MVLTDIVDPGLYGVIAASEPNRLTVLFQFCVTK